MKPGSKPMAAFTALLAFGTALSALGVVATRPAQAQGALYRWVDARGVVHFTDTPSDARWSKVSLREPMGPAIEGERPEQYDAVIRRTARKHGLPAALVKAVIRAESNFDPGARSTQGAMGLMQLKIGRASCRERV